MQQQIHIAFLGAILTVGLTVGASFVQAQGSDLGR